MRSHEKENCRCGICSEKLTEYDCFLQVRTYSTFFFFLSFFITQQASLVIHQIFISKQNKTFHTNLKKKKTTGQGCYRKMGAWVPNVQDDIWSLCVSVCVQLQTHRLASCLCQWFGAFQDMRAKSQRGFTIPSGHFSRAYLIQRSYKSNCQNIELLVILSEIGIPIHVFIVTPQNQFYFLLRIENTAFCIIPLTKL